MNTENNQQQPACNSFDHHPKDLLLDYYHCTLFLPLLDFHEKGYRANEKYRFYYSAQENPDLADAEAQAYLYFSPALRNILFDCNKKTGQLDAVQEWRLDNDTIKNWQLHLGKQPYKIISVSNAIEQQQTLHDFETTLHKDYDISIVHSSSLPNQYLIAGVNSQAEFVTKCIHDPKHNLLQALQEKTTDESKIAELAYLELGYTAAQTHMKYQRSNIVSVRLFQYFNNIYLLAIRVESEALSILRQKKSDKLFDNNTDITLQQLVQQDPANKSYYHQLAMENWLHFTRHIRLLYPSFPQQNDENKIAPIHLIRPGKNTITAFKDKIDKIKIHQNPGHDFSPVVTTFLKAFAKQPGQVNGIVENYDNLHDDRLFVSVAYSIAGKQLPQKSLDRINTLVNQVDRQEDDGFSSMGGYAYTPEVILEKVQDNTFSLWQGLGAYYSYSDFSNTYLSTGWAFRNYIAPEHIPHIYDRMLIQALFYQASLRHYDNQICEETSQLLKQKNFTAIRDQRKEFIKFTNQYWFHNLTAQMQGKEIFKLQQQTLGLQQHYDIIKDELERTEEYLQTEHEITISQLTDNFTRYGLLFALIALYYAALPIINEAITTKSSSLSIWLLASSWLNCSYFYTEVSGLVILLLLVPIGVYLLINLLCYLIKISD